MNQWDELTDIFGFAWEENSIPEYAADNILIAWPSIINCIDNELLIKPDSMALDFGCGGGLFCKKLSQMGFNVTGYDTSEELVKTAKLNTPSEVTVTNSEDVMIKNGKYDLISSIMVFQFIFDIKSTIKNIASLLKPDGLAIFAVFNPQFIADNSNAETFPGFDDFKTGYMLLKEGIKIPVCNRTEDTYRKIFRKEGLEEVYLDYPGFTEDFLKAYNIPLSTRYSEYLIQGFRYKRA